MPRSFHVKGTKTFYYWSLALLALGAWAVKDGWFPSEAKILSKTAEELANFQLFNKSLAILCLSISGVCGYIHKVVK